MSNSVKDTVPLCPRCGYDQSGACAAWRDECPLEGKCPECGLKFEWSDAFNPLLKQSPWLFEHKRPWSPGLIRALRSWFRALIPPRFWRAVTPAHHTNAKVWLWPVVLVVSLLLLGAGTHLVVQPLVPAPLRGTPWPQFGTPVYWQFSRDVLENFGLRPLWFPRQPWMTDEWYGRSLREAWSFPLSILASSAVCAVILLNLRASRRIAGVKTEHIIRASVYRLAPLGVLYLTWLVLAVSASNALNLYRDRDHLLGFGVPIVCIVWGWWWWRSAIVTGWFMPNSRLAASLIGVVDVLTSLLVLALMNHRAIGAILG